MNAQAEKEAKRMEAEKAKEGLVRVTSLFFVNRDMLMSLLCEHVCYAAVCCLGWRRRCVDRRVPKEVSLGSVGTVQ